MICPSLVRFCCVTLLAPAATLALTGCSKPASGCAGDIDCKGDRLCVAGVCADPSPSPVPPQPSSQTPVLQSATATPPPQRYAADGLPEEIPPPTSPVPTLSEWGAVAQVPVRGAVRLQCETKMVREWLRVSCFKNLKGEPVEVYNESGPAAFTFNGNGLTSVVVQVIRGKTYKGRYIWDKSGTRSGAELVVSWPADVERPALSFVEDGVP